jgi:hypothetical protein
MESTFLDVWYQVCRIQQMSFGAKSCRVRCTVFPIKSRRLEDQLVFLHCSPASWPQMLPDLRLTMS